MNRDQAIDEIDNLLENTNLTWSALDGFYQNYFNVRYPRFVNDTIREWSEDPEDWNRLWNLLNIIFGGGDFGSTRQQPPIAEEPGGTYGEGIIRAEGKLRPSVLSLLKQVGNEKITSLTIWRRILPYSKVVKFLAPDVAPDKLYHTSLNINGKYNLEKDGVSVVFTRGKPDGETLSVKVPSGSNLTIQELFDKTRKRMGDKDFGDYNIEKLNCQNFVDNMLSAIGLNSAEARKFVNQETEKVIESLGGKWVKALATAYQAVKEVGDVVQEGGACSCQDGMGTGEYIYNYGLPRCKIQY